jgi:hypothetical protein
MPNDRVTDMSYSTPPETEVLREPKDKFERTVRQLAEAAMSAIHHDSSEADPEYTHEVAALERRFGLILRGKLRP